MIKFKLYAAILISAYSIKVYAQDTIFKTDQSILIGKVMEVNNSTVKFKLSGSSIENVLEEKVTNIHHISYSKGFQEFYNRNSIQTAEVKGKEKNIVPVDYIAVKKDQKIRKNIIAINLFEMVFTNFGCSYERIFAAGKLSLKIPFSLGVGGKQNKTDYKATSIPVFFMQNKIYGTGLEINLYPIGQDKHVFYIGLSTEYGKFNYYKDTNSYNNYNYNSYSYPAIEPNASYEGVHYAGILHIGGNIGLTQELLFGLKAGVGYRYEETLYEDFTRPIVKFDFNLAYRF